MSLSLTPQPGSTIFTVAYYPENSDKTSLTMYEKYEYDHNGFLTHAPKNDNMRGCLRTAVGWIIAFVILFIIGALSSCRSTRTVLIEVRDSTSTHVHHEVVYVPDTIPVVLPPQIVEKTTPDTASTLRIGHAESTAAIRGGMLFHSLRSLQNPIPVPVQHKETVRDSIVYREKEVPKEVPVVQEVEKPLTWWQQFRIHVANIVLWVLVIYAAFIAVRFWLLKK